MSRTRGHTGGSRSTYRKEHPSHSSNKHRKQDFNRRQRTERRTIFSQSDDEYNCLDKFHYVEPKYKIRWNSN